MWPHLKNLPFHKLGPTSTVDVLIGLDCADLHFSFKDVRGKPGQPVARLTPLGCTCIGAMERQSQESIRTNFVKTYFVTSEIDNVDMNEVNMTLRRFWEIDNSGIDDVQVLSAEDNFILDKAQQSIKFIDGHYRIAISPGKKREFPC